MEKKKKRDVSRERTIALALIEVIEKWQGFDESKSETNTAVEGAVDRALGVLKTHGYSGLESISSRVAKIEAAISAAVVARNGKEIARLGAELNRAQRGLPPIAKVVPAVKTRKRKEKVNGLDADPKRGEQKSGDLSV